MLGSDGCECITFTQFGCEVYGFSYNLPQIDKPLYDGLMPDENDAFHILLAHGGDALHIPYRTEEMERSGFDYIALGHIHKPQILLKDRAAYSGALSPIDAGDEGPHGYIVGETHGHSAHLQFVEKAKREYVTMTVTVNEEDTALSLRDEVASAIRKRGSDNIYKIVLRGQRRVGVHFDTESGNAPADIQGAADRPLHRKLRAGCAAEMRGRTPVRCHWYFVRPDGRIQ